MAVLRCKVCGGKVTFAKDSKVAVCEFCGAEQTFDELEDVVPKKPEKSKGTKKNGAIKRVRNDPRLRRGFELLSDGEFDKAYRFFEHVLDDDVGNAGAYLGKLMALYEFWTIEELETSGLRLKEDENYWTGWRRRKKNKKDAFMKSGRRRNSALPRRGRLP